MLSWFRGPTPRRVAVGYAALLAASHVVEHAFPAVEATQLHVARVHAVNGGILEPQMVQIAYRDSNLASAEIPVVLVHGSPGSSAVLEKLGDLLASRFRVIVPDLPGFGASTRDIPDYSFRAHGDYLVQLLDLLNIRKIKIVGFSMGGGVALSIAERAPERVQSIVMLSAIGLQEYELTGDYRLNHGLHAGQLGVFWLLKNGLPHFGLVRQMHLTVEYARNFYDSDQRPLRSVLEHYRAPMLILHGREDRNVPIAAAREHHKLVPQSRLVELEGDHFLAFMRPQLFLEPLVNFLSQR